MVARVGPQEDEGCPRRAWEGPTSPKVPQGASWSLLRSLGASWGLLAPRGASWGLLRFPVFVGASRGCWGVLGFHGVSWGLLGVPVDSCRFLGPSWTATCTRLGQPTQIYARWWSCLNSTENTLLDPPGYPGPPWGLLRPPAASWGIWASWRLGASWALLRPTDTGTDIGTRTGADTGDDDGDDDDGRAA